MRGQRTVKENLTIIIIIMFLSYLHPTVLTFGTSDYNHLSRKHIGEVVRLTTSFLGALKNNVIGDLLWKN